MVVRGRRVEGQPRRRKLAAHAASVYGAAVLRPASVTAASETSRTHRCGRQFDRWSSTDRLGWRAVLRVLSSFLLLLLLAAPSARADGFREREVRDALTAAGSHFRWARSTVTTGRAAPATWDAIFPKPAALGTSRFGGRPDLPTSAAWPMCKGKHQTFLAQIRVRELPGGARELRRLGGTLLFFTHVEFEEGERDYGLYGGECTTVLHARAGTALRRTALPGDTLRMRPSRPRFTARPDVPDFALDEDTLMGPLHEVKVADWERWFEIRDLLRGKPRLEHVVLGYSRAPNGGDDCSERAERARDTWRHLFTIGPDDKLGFNVADAGALQILIAPADLRAGRFDRVCGVFDSA